MRVPLYSSPIETQNTGNPWAKFVVPSNGSTYQRYSLPESLKPSSSPKISCEGHSAPMRSRIKASDLRSATVTRSASPLYSTATWRLKYCISSAPASRAISDIDGMRLSWSRLVGINSQFQVIDRRSRVPCPCGILLNLKSQIYNLQSSSRALLRFICDVHDFMFEDKKIGFAVAGQPHHILIVVFDPSLN